VERDYWGKFETLAKDTERVLKETNPEQFTKEFTMRLRLHRDLNAPFEKAGHEYGNYEKYENDANSVNVENEDGQDDDGESKIFRNY
jgi:hypothetical protein